MQSLTLITILLTIGCFMPSTIQAIPVALESEATIHTETDNAGVETPMKTYEAPAPVEERANRHPRATCDLLSFQSKWLSVNHSACAAHCLALMRGFKGGRCQDGVCHCRK